MENSLELGSKRLQKIIWAQGSIKSAYIIPT
jgi:hypothetical protein